MDDDRWQLIDESVRGQITEEVRLGVAIGRRDFEQVVRGVTDIWTGEVEDCDLLDRLIREIAVREFEGHLAVQAGWPETTDSDRLSLAMKELSMAGIVAREHHTCCMTCGLREMRRELGRLSGARGYVFYHEEDAQRAVRGEGVFLAFGPADLDDGVDPVEGIGGDIIRALRHRGLDVIWGGDTGQRIYVRMNWQRRRFGWLADYPGGDTIGEIEGGLHVTFYDDAWTVMEEPMTVSGADARRLLAQLTPRDGNSVGCQGRSGEVLRFTWEAGVRLRAESPDTGTGAPRGRYVTLDEGLALIAVLAQEGRVGLEGLGELRVGADRCSG